ncbi:substrate-binding periplasmic protein [Chitinibacteraceae bacterium HSL-7]
MMKWVWCSAVLVLAAHGKAADLTVMVGNNPPFNRFVNGAPEGMAVDVVNVLRLRAELSFLYIDYPWARAYLLAQRDRDHCVYTLGRIVEREGLFQWIGPITYNRWAFFALKSRQIRLRSLDDARAYRVGGQQKDAKMIWLAGKGFLPDLANTEEQSLLKLKNGYIDLYAAGLYTAPEIARKLGLPEADIEPVLVFHRVDNYIGCSLATSTAKVAKLQWALDAMRQDGSLERIRRQFEAKLPDDFSSVPDVSER